MQTFNPHELVTVAIKIERNGQQYYETMAARTKNQAVREIFQMMAEQEAQHILDFTRIQKSLSASDYDVPDVYRSDEMEAYLESLGDGRIFVNQRGAEEVVGEIEDEIAAIRHAISFEKDSLIFFREIQDLMPPELPDRDAVGELCRQEKIHLARLYTLLRGLTSL